MKNDALNKFSTQTGWDRKILTNRGYVAKRLAYFKALTRLKLTELNATPQDKFRVPRVITDVSVSAVHPFPVPPPLLILPSTAFWPPNGRKLISYTSRYAAIFSEEVRVVCIGLDGYISKNHTIKSQSNCKCIPMKVKNGLKLVQW